MEKLKFKLNTKAFTLTELIVVIIIFAILAAISFIGISNYVATARDAKRLNDITELYKKIILEKEKEPDLENLVINPEIRRVLIGGRLQDVIVGTINFQALRENALNFKPPREGEEYLVAISVGSYIDPLTGQERGYSFVQVKAEKEVGDGHFIAGNYYIIKVFDAVDLFVITEINSCYIENGIGEQIGEGPCEVKSCNPNHIHIISLNTCEPVWFKTTWKVGATEYGDGSNAITFYIEIPANTTAVIDWGDGTKENIVNGTIVSSRTPTHTYTEAGDYQVKIQNITRFHGTTGTSTVSRDYIGKLISVDDWGNIVWSRMDYMFNSAVNLVSLPTSAPNLTNVTNMRSTLAYTFLFNQDISNWDVSNVANMNRTFEYASIFNQPLNWDTRSVTDMQYMFYFALAFNQPLNDWNVSNVIYMNNVFAYASLFNQPLNKWNTSSATDMGSLFNQAKSFSQDISMWCVTNIASKPGSFDSSTPSTFQNKPAMQPQWGTCP